MRFQTEFLPDVRGCFWRIEKWFNIHTAKDRGELLPLCDSGRNILICHRPTDGDEMIAPLCGHAFGHLISRMQNRILPVMKCGSMDRVHCRDTQLRRRATAQDTGFGTVRVHDLRLVSFQLANDGSIATPVAPRV